jgi:hypothetical protein
LSGDPEKIQDIVRSYEALEGTYSREKLRSLFGKIGYVAAYSKELMHLQSSLYHFFWEHPDHNLMEDEWFSQQLHTLIQGVLDDEPHHCQLAPVSY